MPSSRTLTLPIEGMSCNGCANRLQRAFDEIEGVSATVDFPSKSAQLTIAASVDYDNSVHAILAVISAKGYQTTTPSDYDSADKSATLTVIDSGKAEADATELTAHSNTQELLIEGATCASCVNKIEKSLHALTGVQQAQMNLPLRTVSVTGNVAKETLIATIVAAGYQAKSTGNASDQQLLEEKQQAEQINYQKLITQMWIALGLGIPLMLYGMLGGAMTVNTAIERTIWLVIGLICVAVMYFAGRHFYIAAWRALLNHSASMDTLIALGTGTAWLYSMVVVISPEALPEMARHLYFEASAMIIAFVNLGLALELKARGRTSEAIQRLIGLQAKTARVIRNGKEVDIAIAAVLVNDLVRVRPVNVSPLMVKSAKGQPALMNRCSLASRCRLRKGSMTKSLQAPSIKVARLFFAPYAWVKRPHSLASSPWLNEHKTLNHRSDV